MNNSETQFEVLDFPKEQFKIKTLQKIHDECRTNYIIESQKLKDDDVNNDSNEYEEECKRIQEEYKVKCDKLIQIDKDVKLPPPPKLPSKPKAGSQSKKQLIKDTSDGLQEKLNKLQMKCYKPVTDYVYLYYYETNGANYWFYDCNDRSFKKVKNDEFLKEVINKIDKSLFCSLFEKNHKIFRIVSRLNRPRTYKENGYYFINECGQYLHTKYKQYNDYSEDVKAKVDKVLNMIKVISCNSNDELFEAYIKYLSQLVKGQKTEVVIYKKSEQGTGKSTETDFIINYVLGKDLCVISGTEPLLSNFNKILLGKLLVVFEELPTFSQKEWEVVSSKIKTMTTEKTFIYRSLFKDAIEAENISNFMINTNVESIKDSDGRRIMIMPVSNVRKGDKEYFEDLRKTCFNLEVGEAFFSYLMGIDTTSFYAQTDFPETENKRLAIANLLHPVYKFLKFNFVLKTKGLEKIKPKDLYDNYICWSKISDAKRIVQKTDFFKKMEDIGIKYKITSGARFYKETYEDLKFISDSNKWLCEYDEVENDEEEDDDDSDDETTINWKEKYLQLEKEMKTLKESLNIKN